MIFIMVCFSGVLGVLLSEVIFGRLRFLYLPGDYIMILMFKLLKIRSDALKITDLDR